MKISEFSEAELRSRLRRAELLLNITPFVVRLCSDIPAVARDLALMYGDFEVSETDAFADFHVEVSLEWGLRRWIKPHARFFFDGRPSFVSLPVGQAFAMLEWGINWCVAAHSHQYLIIHAAVVEREGKAAILPAPPGSGKSTLCAALINRGWRLLSDELALCDMDTGLLYGMCRPVNLKNRSVGIIREFAPEAVMTAAVPDTSKGTIVLMRPPPDSVRGAAQAARPVWVVLPNYSAGASVTLERHSPARTFMLIAEQSFNYDIHGSRGFDTVGRLIDQSQCYKLSYSRLDDAVRMFDELLAGRIG